MQLHKYKAVEPLCNDDTSLFFAEVFFALPVLVAKQTLIETVGE